MIEGYKAIYSAMVEKNYPTAGLVELLLSLNIAGRVNVQTGLQQPMRLVLIIDISFTINADEMVRSVKEGFTLIPPRSGTARL